MKALSLKQPMAWAIFHGKDVENRKWKTNYRGHILIHASNNWDWNHHKWLLDNEDKLGILVPARSLFVKQAFLGMITIIDCVEHHASPWFFGPYGFVLTDPVEFEEPIPYPGSQGFFEVPDFLIENLQLKIEN